MAWMAARVAGQMPKPNASPTDDTRVGFDANQQDFHRAIKPRELWAWSVDFKREA